MTAAPLLDTHIWLWWLLGDERFGRREVDFLDRLPESDRPHLSDISLWELALLVDRGRLRLDRSLDDFLKIAAAPATVQLRRIDATTVVEMNALPDSFHRDPADRVIVATSRAKGLTLVTHDQRIIDSRLAPIWHP